MKTVLIKSLHSGIHYWISYVYRFNIVRGIIFKYLGENCGVCIVSAGRRKFIWYKTNIKNINLYERQNLILSKREEAA